MLGQCAYCGITLTDNEPITCDHCRMSVVTARLNPNERKTMNDIFDEMDTIVGTFFDSIEAMTERER